MGYGQFVVMCSTLLMFLKVASGDDSITKECTAQVQKVIPCLNYATGQGNSPSKECCIAVEDLKETEPKCLCFVMQQAQNGSEQIKSLGIQLARLLKLPSACQLKNASISFCPKLLGISPSSPDAAIFTNATTATTPPASSTGTPSSASDKSDGSNRNKHRHYLSGPLVITMAVFMCTICKGFTSMFQVCG